MTKKPLSKTITNIPIRTFMIIVGTIGFLGTSLILLPPKTVYYCCTKPRKQKNHSTNDNEAQNDLADNSQQTHTTIEKETNLNTMQNPNNIIAVEQTPHNQEHIKIQDVEKSPNKSTLITSLYYPPSITKNTSNN